MQDVNKTDPSHKVSHATNTKIRHWSKLKNYQQGCILRKPYGWKLYGRKFYCWNLFGRTLLRRTPR